MVSSGVEHEHVYYRANVNILYGFYEVPIGSEAYKEGVSANKTTACCWTISSVCFKSSLKIGPTIFLVVLVSFCWIGPLIATGVHEIVVLRQLVAFHRASRAVLVLDGLWFVLFNCVEQRCEYSPSLR